MSTRPIWRVFSPLAFVALSSCSDQANTPLTAPGSVSAAVGVLADIPERGADIKGAKQWADEPDSVLWAAANKVGNAFAIGVKTPGTRRGIYRATRIVDQSVWLQAPEILGRQAGVEIYKVDDILPLIKAKITDYSTFVRVRRLPIVDYIEPALIAYSELRLSSTSGCDYPGHHNPPGANESYGDFIPSTYSYSKVNWAWYYAPEAGAGVTIGLVDTGVDQNVSELGSSFSSGLSTGRWFTQTSTIGGGSVTCSHGTRMAGVMAAPRNGVGAVGVAYRANLYSSWGQNSVASDNGIDQQQAIRDAVNGGASVVSMAWRTGYASYAVDDEINYNYYNRDVLFVGAAGTTWADLSQNNVLFPASKWEVLAVSAADYDGTRDNQSHYGPELDLVSYHPIATVGAPGWAVDEIANSSSATAFVTGVAALVRARYPWMTNRQAMDRMVATAGLACRHYSVFGPIVNAEAAVGGMCELFVNGPPLVEFYDESPQCQTVTYSAVHTGGVGPFSYQWNWGDYGTPTNTQSIQQTFCRPATSVDDNAYVYFDLTDQGVAAPTRRVGMSTRIVNWSAYPCEERPNAVQCPPRP
jgi:serine protease